MAVKKAAGTKRIGKSKTASAHDPRYSREELLENAEALFQCKPEVVAGALYDYEQNEFTIDEMKQCIQDFLKRKVK